MTTIAAVILWNTEDLSPTTATTPPVVRETPSDNPGKRSFLVNTFEELAGHELVPYLPFRYGDTLPDGSRCTGVGWSRITKYVWRVECCFCSLERGMLTRNEAREFNKMENWE